MDKCDCIKCGTISTDEEVLRTVRSLQLDRPRVFLEWLETHYMGRAILDDAIRAFGLEPIERCEKTKHVALDKRGLLTVVFLTEAGYEHLSGSAR